MTQRSPKLLDRVWLLVLCLAHVRISQQQVVEANLPYKALCSIPEEVVRVLPSSGFSRSPSESWVHTLVGSDMSLSNLSSCLYWSFDPSFDALLGPNPTIYQVGPTTTTYTYTETPAFLPGKMSKPIPSFRCHLVLCCRSEMSRFLSILTWLCMV